MKLEFLRQQLCGEYEEGGWKDKLIMEMTDEESEIYDLWYADPLNRDKLQLTPRLKKIFNVKNTGTIKDT